MDFAHPFPKFEPPIGPAAQIYAPTTPAFGKTSAHLSNWDSIALVWFATFNVVTFLTFGYDKWRAGRSGQRVSELTLVMLGAIGGWPGGLIGMNVFRHKTAKWTFKLKYAFALLPFAAEVWAWWHWR